MTPDKPPVDPGQTVDPEPGTPDHGATGEHIPQPDETPVRPATTTDCPPASGPGAVIAGRYTLLDKIGEGGMGEVWVAQQTEPVKRKVALKLIKTGMDSKAVLQRFEQERQALAVMDHPNIARVLDGGMTPAGQPFFVMELVNGLPLTRFCDDARLTTKQRLELFVPICQAVQHAHQKGIVHRDLKPANILVTLIDARPVPKVIDFGVAKATGGKLTDESLSTQFGAIVGTLEYMAPEQAGSSGGDIDTRADIYSLGVILYELLTGLRPIDARRLRTAALTEVLRIIQEEEPARPSTRLSAAEALPALAALRQTEPKKLMALLRGELDCVVLKCLEKQRQRRYETVNALARDVQRYLADEVVEARPPSAGYRLKKFVRRHKGQVLAASLVLVTLLTGMAGTTWGLIAARQKTALAEKAAGAERLAKLDAEGQKKKAEEEKAIAVAVKDFLQYKLLRQASVSAQAGALLKAGGLAEQARKDPTIRELLDRAALELSETKIEANFPNQPLLQAEILHTLGDTYHGVGEYGRAIGFLERSLALRKARLGPEHPETLQSMATLALVYSQAGKLDRALPLYEETFKLRKARLGAEHPDTLTSMGNLAVEYQAAGKLDRALPLYEQTLALRKARFGPEDLGTLVSMGNLASAYQEAGDLDRALPLFKQALERMKAKLGPEHPRTLITMNQLALAYQQAGELDRAVSLLEQALKVQKAKFDPDHPNTLWTMQNLAWEYFLAGKRDRAQPLAEEALDLIKARYRLDHPHTLRMKKSLEYLRALLAAEERYRAKVAEFGPKHIAALLARRDMAQMYMAMKRLDDAESVLSEVLRGMKDRAPDDPILLFTIALLQRCLVERQRSNPDAWATFNTRSLLGGALLGLKKYTHAEPLLLKGYEGMKKWEAKIPAQQKVRLAEAVERIVQLYEATGKKVEAARWRKELSPTKKDGPPP